MSNKSKKGDNSVIHKVGERENELNQMLCKVIVVAAIRWEWFKKQIVSLLVSFSFYLHFNCNFQLIKRNFAWYIPIYCQTTFNWQNFFLYFRQLWRNETFVYKEIGLCSFQIHERKSKLRMQKCVENWYNRYWKFECEWYFITNRSNEKFEPYNFKEGKQQHQQQESRIH